MTGQIVNPWYTASVKVRGCGYDLRINDCPLLRHRRRPASCAIPVNHWLHSGVNILTAELLPLPGESRVRKDAQLQFDLLVREDRGGPNAMVASARLNENEENAGILRTAVQIEVPFPAWNWRSSTVLEATSSVLSSLLNELDIIHGFIASNNIPALVDRAEERISETAAATFQSTADVAGGLRDSWQSLITEPGFVLQPPEKQDAMLWIFGDGRLAAVTDRFAQSTIFCRNQDGISGRAEFIFRMDVDKGWLICR